MYIYIYIHYTFLSAEGFECLDTEIGHFTDMCIFQECYKWSNADSLGSSWILLWSARRVWKEGEKKDEEEEEGWKLDNIYSRPGARTQ